jgi:glutamyl-tRNA synthetase
MASPPVVRFAPSPTGRIHIGNARAALLNWLFAKRHGGTFILRFDDTDLERSKAEYAEAIEADLDWLGIKPDLVRRQSERMAAYDEAAARLKALGRLYPAYETAEELDRRRKLQQALEASGRKPHWRFGSNRPQSAGTTLCAVKAASTARRCPIRFCAARTEPTFIRCLRWSTTSTSASRTSSAVRITAEAVRPVDSLDELASLVDLSHLSHGAARFDEAELEALSARTLHRMPYPAVADRLAALGVAGPDAQALWLAVRGNLSRLDEAAIWREVVEGKVVPIVEDADFLTLAASYAPDGPWDHSTWAAWTTRLKELTGRKGRALFHPLRLALTGREAGPELAALLPLIGRARAVARLSAPTV